MSATKADMAVARLYSSIDQQEPQDVVFTLLSSAGDLRNTAHGASDQLCEAVKRVLEEEYEVELVEYRNTDACAQYIPETGIVKYNPDCGTSVITVNLIRELTRVLQDSRCLNQHSEEVIDIEAQAVTFAVADHFNMDVGALALDIRLRDGKHPTALTRGEDRIRELITTTIRQIEEAL